MTTITSVEQFDSYFHQPSVHPFVSVAELSRISYSINEPTDFGMFAVIYLDSLFGELTKCGKMVNYKPQSIVWLRPGETIAMKSNFTNKPRGWILAFRPELLEKSGLGRDFYMFGFFNYHPSKALELSNPQRAAVLNAYANIQMELLSQRDYLTNHMLRLGIGQLLTFCKRLFESQFSELPAPGSGIAERLEHILENYLSSGLPEQQGHPTVAWCAEQFGVTANYFGELVRRELRMTAREFIHSKIVECAGRLLTQTTLSVNEVALQLGFDYPTHFVRMFKGRTGLSPLHYRRQFASEQKISSTLSSEPSVSVGVIRKSLARME